MTWRDMMAVVLALIFLSSGVCGVLGDREVSKFVKWLYRNKRQIWRENRSPGTFSFKGDSRNSLWNRMSAYSMMSRSGRLDELHRKFSGKEAGAYLEKRRKYHLISGLLLASGFVLIAVLVVVEECIAP